jgi:hypothetical protein
MRLVLDTPVWRVPSVVAQNIGRMHSCTIVATIID